MSKAEEARIRRIKANKKRRAERRAQYARKKAEEQKKRDAERTRLKKIWEHQNNRNYMIAARGWEEPVIITFSGIPIPVEAEENIDLKSASTETKYVLEQKKKNPDLN